MANLGVSGPGRTQAEQLAQFVVHATYDDLSSTARQQLKIRVLYALGCALGALDGEPLPLIRVQLEDFGGAQRCTLIGGGLTAPDRAAFYNGALVRYRPKRLRRPREDRTSPERHWSTLNDCRRPPQTLSLHTRIAPPHEGYTVFEPGAHCLMASAHTGIGRLSGQARQEGCAPAHRSPTHGRGEEQSFGADHLVARARDSPAHRVFIGEATTHTTGGVLRYVETDYREPALGPASATQLTVCMNRRARTRKYL